MGAAGFYLFGTSKRPGDHIQPGAEGARPETAEEIIPAENFDRVR